MQDRPATLPGCQLCDSAGGDVVWRDDRLRVVLPDEPDYPGFTRVIWRVHASEMTDLEVSERESLMRAVWIVEGAQRSVLAPDKINLASLGNVVPHLHWHVIPRWRDDRHFPQPVWGAAAQRDEAEVAARRLAVRALLPAYREALAAALG